MTGKDLGTIVAENVRRLRAEKNMTQATLGAKIGVHQVHVNRLEREKRSITLETLAKFAEALEVEPRDLL